MDNSKLIMISVRCQTKVHNVQSFGWGYTSQTNRKKSVDKCNCQRLLCLLLIELSFNHSRASSHYTIIRNVMHYQAASSNNTSVSDGYTR